MKLRVCWCQDCEVYLKPELLTAAFGASPQARLTSSTCCRALAITDKVSVMPFVKRMERSVLGPFAGGEKQPPVPSAVQRLLLDFRTPTFQRLES